MARASDLLSSIVDAISENNRNLSVPSLVEKALQRKEGVLARSGALAVQTGKYTGRSPDDRFVVLDEETRGSVDWGAVNKSVAPDVFDRLYERVVAYLSDRELFLFDGFAGADPSHSLPVRVINEYAWQNLFVHQLLIRPGAGDATDRTSPFKLICAPGFKADPQRDGTHSEAFVFLDFSRSVGIIGGTRYAGEQKKAIFSVMNYVLPGRDVLPMHCSANVGADGDVALFFGLSGTGKTTLSTDPNRRLIGDDEHGWSKEGVFNFEGGCYAKTIGLSHENEPQIWEAVRFGSILENVDIDAASREVDFESDKYTQNTRVAYPIDYIPGSVIPGVNGHPKTVIFLTADAFGVLPPIARLSPQQAMYHFMTGYTSKLAGTERGIKDPRATFSACFGAPFLPRSPVVYAELLGERIREHDTPVYLVNTGWTGGPYGTGRRMDLGMTRAMVAAAIKGDLNDVPVRPDPIFGIGIPVRCPGVPDAVLQPKNTWDDPEAYDKQARELAGRFSANFTQFTGIPSQVVAAGPTS